MPTLTTEVTNIEINRDNFNVLLERLKDLAKVSNVIKFKIDTDDTLIYAIKGSKTSVNVLKSYTLKTDDIFTVKEPITETLNWIVNEAGKFVKNLQFIRIDHKISLKLSHRTIEDCEVRSAEIRNSRFRLRVEIGDSDEIMNITKEQLSEQLRKDRRSWGFSVSPSDFTDIKKLSSINSSDANRVLYLDVEEKNVKISERNIWELIVDEVEEEENHLIFNKAFLGFINETGVSIEFNVFPNFIFIEDDDSNLMISFEQDFS